MPTIFTHVAVPVCAAIALGKRRVPVAALLVGMLAAIVPDFDGLAFKLGIAYG
ncbi:metal-dependent hydrolase, partial [Acinetobacter baumannii]|uniref:metal-dependent hydrolase n=2 Tax=Pseudomonadota TaxID=1224 RepID=UPI001C443D88|nr:metal-dependent hydrolase [Acinetobacter baumannii]